MSDFGDPQHPSVPPPPGPPPFSAVPPPPGPTAPFAPTPPPPGAYPPAPGFYPSGPGFQPYGAAAKPARPVVAFGAWLLVAGGLVACIGSFLNWFTVEGIDVNGFSDAGGNQKDGPVFLTLGIFLVAAGIALLAARRVLAVAIISIVLAVFTVFAALADIGDVSDADDLAKTAGFEFSAGPGLYLCLVGGLVALAGGIVATAKRRR